VRDAKGKSVAAVFNDLGGNQKAEVRNVFRSFVSNILSEFQILRALAMKVLGSAM
jgi:hypothetical protein